MKSSVVANTRLLFFPQRGIIMDRGRLIELALAKLNDGKDITWEEITELCNWDVNPDHCRKVAYGIKLLDDYLRENKIESTVSDEIDKYEKKKIY